MPCTHDQRVQYRGVACLGHERPAMSPTTPPPSAMTVVSRFAPMVTSLSMTEAAVARVLNASPSGRLIDSVVFAVIIVAWFYSFGLLENAHVAIKVGLLVAAYLIVEPGLVSQTGGTIGHHVMGLRVRDADADQRVGFVRATMRGVTRSLLGLFSLLFMFATRRHQAIHDYISRSTVVIEHPEEMNQTNSYRMRTENRSASGDHALILN